LPEKLAAHHPTGHVAAADSFPYNATFCLTLEIALESFVAGPYFHNPTGKEHCRSGLDGQYRAKCAGGHR